MAHGNVQCVGRARIPGQRCPAASARAMCSRDGRPKRRPEPATAVLRTQRTASRLLVTSLGAEYVECTRAAERLALRGAAAAHRREGTSAGAPSSPDCARGDTPRLQSTWRRIRGRTQKSWRRRPAQGNGQCGSCLPRPGGGRSGYLDKVEVRSKGTTADKNATTMPVNALTEMTGTAGRVPLPGNESMPCVNVYSSGCNVLVRTRMDTFQRVAV